VSGTPGRAPDQLVCLPVTGLAFSPDGARLLVARAGPSGSVLELRP